MSTSDGQTLGSNSVFSSDRPWVSIVAPLAAVLGIGLLAIGLTFLRKRSRRNRALYLNQQGRQALERDLEARITRGAAPGDAWSNPQGRTRVARTANRWAWANNLALGRREEGLNELGEAPPPYEGRAASSHKDEAGVELGDLRRGSSEGADRAVERAGVPSPPAYGDHSDSSGQRGGSAEEETAGESSVAQPAPVALPAGRMRHLYG